MLKAKGSLFVYDFESFPPEECELGAIVWTRAEIQSIVTVMLGALGIKDYQPEVGHWRHKSCTGWNVHIEQEHFDCDRSELLKNADSAISKTENKMKEIMRTKHEQTRQILNSFTENTPETSQERDERTAALYSFWALTRALEEKL